MPTTVPIDTTPSQNQDVNKLVSDIERDLLFYIIMSMKSRKISIGEAHYLAQDFLKLLPVKDKEDLLEKLSGLANTYTEAREVFVKYNTPYEEEKRNKLLNTMRDHIKSGDIEKAIAVAKGGG